jgi:hypothetical protein
VNYEETKKLSPQVTKRLDIVRAGGELLWSAKEGGEVTAVTDKTTLSTLYDDNLIWYVRVHRFAGKS